MVGALAQEVRKLPAETMLAQFAGIASQGEGSIAIAPLPEAVAAPPWLPLQDGGTTLACRTFSGKIDRSWRVASFTSFAAHEAVAGELPDRDGGGSSAVAAAAAVTQPQPAEMSFFTFPRGAHAGIFLHELFEKLDFSTAASAGSDEALAACLKKYGYGGDWLPHLRTMLVNVLTTPLAAKEGHFTLSGLRPGSWLTELEFFFPLKFVTSAGLQTIFRSWSGHYTAVDLLALCKMLRFKPTDGMVRGFMDMVFEHNGRFYLLDWKSNHLGYRLEDYGPAALKAAMEKNLYPLQYLLYTVALNRYLSLRVKSYDYTTHFGGVLYFFLRGVNSERGEEFGIFRDTPPLAMIAELTACLIKAGG
jgi:exodeoxyribonuclease V beta subunit